jgi:AAA+ superfamily predicted ATPase
MTDMPAPQEAPRQPHIDRALWNGSTAEIYDPNNLFQQAQNEGIQIFDRADFGSPIERATLGIEPVLTEDGETAVSASAVIQLDRSTGDLNNLISKFKSRMRPAGGKANNIEVQQTAFSNAFIVTDQENGNTRVAVSIYEDGTIVMSSQRRLASESSGKEVILRAPAAELVDGAEMLRGTARIFMRTIGIAAGTSSPSTEKRLDRTYSLGDVVKPIRKSESVRNIGQQVVRSARTVSPQAPQEGASGQPSMQELGVNMAEEEHITLDDIGGLEDVKAKLSDIATSFSHPEVMAKWGAERPQGVLLYGEPGGGKTMLVKALANEMDADLWMIQGSDIYNMWLGKSEEKIKELFSRARKVTKPTILFFDEIDSIIGTTEEPGPGGGGQARNAVAGIFKQELNTLAADNPNLLICAATNNPDRIDSALTRSGRFGHKIYVPMPNEVGRTEIVSSIMTKIIIRNDGTGFAPFAEDINVTEISKLTDGMSGADISEIFRRISLQKAMQEARTGESSPISHRDLMTTIQGFKTEG